MSTAWAHGGHRVTNIYRREGGEWKMVHHHTDVSPAMNDLLSRLQPPPQ
ncbi:MAG TPA: nuclear transport factor 2 family protein [Chloroflexota bacterium]|nr:nuclear transport factor 2 family protein [Chloroflexota bacterium]